MDKNVKLVAEISNRINFDLSVRAREYLAEGLKKFQASNDSETKQQVSMGLMLIAIELLLKAIIAKRNMVFLYEGLPNEIKFYLTSPSSIPKEFNLKKYELDLVEFNYKTIHFAECVGILNLLAPEARQELKGYFKDAALLRNRAIHGAIGRHYNYEANRVAYLALKVNEIARKGKFVQLKCCYTPTSKDTRFLERYEVRKMDIVKKQIEAAKRKVGDGIESSAEVAVADIWHEMVIPCPICGKKSKIRGEMDHGYFAEGVHDEDGPDIGEKLEFLAYAFYCPSCGLKLSDMKELQLANMQTAYNRDELLEEWHNDFSGFEPINESAQGDR